MATEQASGTLNSGNTWLGPVTALRGRFDLSVVPNGTFSGTVYVQRRLPTDTQEADWRDVKSYTAAAEELGVMNGAWHVRVGIKAAGISAGAVGLTLIGS